MKFAYTIKGVTLNEFEMYDIKEFYEAHCSAEFIFENYDVTAEQAIKLGYEVRRLMNKYGGCEEDAIPTAFEKLGLECKYREEE
jgi:hypothetical protein